MNEDSKKISFLQYLNTVILTVIGALALMIFITVNNVRNQQSLFSTELVRIKTIQDINTAAIKSLDTRVTTLELNYLEYMKTWVDQNYIRKDQK